MGQWFYAEGNRQQRGPLASEELISLYQSSRIAADTLVWRDGMAQWQPLREVAGDIGLVLTAPPTPDPESTPELALDRAGENIATLPPQIPAAAAIPPGPVPPATPMAAVPVPPRTGLSGCAIAAIVAGVAAVVLLGLLGIIAAIAVPAYQEYTLRAKAAQAVANLDPVKRQVAEYVASNGRCPVNDDDGFQAAGNYADGNLAAVHIGRFENSHCGIEAELAVPGTETLDGKLIWLDFDPDLQQWKCTAEPDDKYLPQDCRG